MIRNGKANVIIDGQWGSSGKGLLAGYLYANFPQISAGVCDFMPNAGHTVYLPNGNKFVSRQLPISVAFGKDAYIGPHAALDRDVLKRELISLNEVLPRKDQGKVYVHPLTPLILPEHLTVEQREIGYIASTAKGGHAAAACKAMRMKGTLMAGDCRVQLAEWDIAVADTQVLVQQQLAKGGTVLIETAQGFDLGLNHGTSYPFVTGRDCLVGRALDNAGVPIRDVGSIIGCVRTFPIRVGNTDDGWSGPAYPDNMEVDWAYVSKQAGTTVIEKTTVTNRVRRVFTFSFKQFRRFLTFVRPDCVFLNYFNYTAGQPPEERAKFLEQIQGICHMHGAELRLVGCGPRSEDVIDLDDAISRLSPAFFP